MATIRTTAPKFLPKLKGVPAISKWNVPYFNQGNKPLPMPLDFFGCFGQIARAPNNTYNWIGGFSDASGFMSFNATGGRNNQPCLQIQQTIAVSSQVGLSPPVGARKVYAFGWFQPVSVPVSGSGIMIGSGGPATSLGIQYSSVAGLRAFAGANVVTYSGTVTLGNWYFIQCLIDTSQDPYTIQWSVYGETEGLLTVEAPVSSPTGQVPADVTVIRFGQSSTSAQWGDATNVGVRFKDFGIGTDVAAYPVPVLETVLMKPASVGIHNPGAGAFQKTGAVAVDGTDTNSYLELDEQPPSGSDWVAQTTIDATAYLEYGFQPFTSLSALVPVAMKFYSEHQGAAVGAYGMEIRLNDGADSTDITSGANKGTTTLVDYSRELSSPISNSSPAALDPQFLNQLKFRFGYSTDATPDAQLNAAFVEALVPIAVGKAYTDSDIALSVQTASAVEEHTTFDSDTAAFSFTASAAEVHEIPDADTAAWVITASAVEEHTTLDSATGTWILTTSATDVEASVDAATAAFSFVTSATDVEASVEAATAAWIITTSATELHTIFDADTAAWILTASATDVAAYIGADTAIWQMTTSATEVHTIFDVGTAAWVISASTTAPDVAATTEAATALWVLTASGTDVAAYVGQDTAQWIMHAYPDVVSNQILHDVFARTTASDWGTATDGSVWIHGFGVATNEFTFVDHAAFKVPNGASQTLSQLVYKPHTNVRYVETITPTVLTSTVVGGGFRHDVRLRCQDSQATNSSGYEFRLTLSTGGNLAVLIARVDAGTVTTLVTSSTIFTSGTWSLSDDFYFECVCMGTVLELRLWKTTGTRPQTPTQSYDTASDATKYANGSYINLRALSNGTATADEEWDFLAIDMYSLDETAATVDADQAAFVLTPATIFEEHATYDSVTAAWQMTASAIEIHEIPDAGTGAWVLTASATEIYAPSTADTGTASWVVTTSATEIHTTFDSSTAAWALTASATESHTIFDAATASSVLTASGTDLKSTTDSDAGLWIIMPTTVELFAGIDTGTGSWVLTAITQAEDFGKIDTGTAAAVFTASGLEEHDIQDAATVQFFQTPGTAFEFIVADADTALWGFDVTALETINLAEAGAAIWAMSPFATETADTVDTATVDTATFVYEAGTVEVQSLLDYYLVADQFKRWHSSQTGHFTTVQERHYVVGQTKRWGVTYLGRGLLTGG